MALRACNQENSSSSLSGANGTGSFRVQLIRLDSLNPTEHHDDCRVTELVKMILKSGVWTTPILAEFRSLAVMDGHHRLAAAQLLGLRRIPGVRLQYDDPRLSLNSWRPDRTYTVKDVLRAAATQDLLPIKSTRHILSADLPALSIPLATLREAPS